MCYHLSKPTIKGAKGNICLFICNQPEDTWGSICVIVTFLAHLHFSAEELLLYPRLPCRRPRWRRRPRPHAKFQSFYIFSCILSLLIILIKPLTTKAHDRRASGDCTCGTSGTVKAIVGNMCSLIFMPPGLKGLPGAFSNQIVHLSVCNSIPLTNKVQY